MPERLPTPGGDNDSWGTVLNNFLAVSHSAEGTLKPAETAQFSTRTELTTTSIVNNDIEYLRTNGYATAGDGGAALYRRVEAEPGHAGKVQSGDGTWWEYVPGPEGVNVRCLGAADNADSTTAFRDALTIAIALQSSHRFVSTNGPSYSGSWDKGILPVHIPAGTYQIDMSDGDLWSLTSGNAIRGINIHGAGIDSTFLRIVGGSGNWLMRNNNKAEGIYFSNFSVNDETGNKNGLFYGTSSGTFKRPSFRNIYIYYMKGIKLDGTGNADHLRCENMLFHRVPEGVCGVEIDNPQSVDNIFIACEMLILHGIGIKVTAGGVISWYGGSIVVALDGRFLHIEGSGSDIGSGNNAFEFYHPKFEMRDIDWGSATSDPTILYLDASAVVNFYGGNYTTDEVSGSRTLDPFIIKRGKVQVHGAANWSTDYKITIDAVTSGYLLDLPPEVAFFGCHLKGQLADFITLNEPSGGTADYQSGARAAASGCFGVDDKNPVDVVMNHTRGQSSLVSSLKRAVFTNGAHRNGSLPNQTSITRIIPQGAVIVNVGVRKEANSGGASATYIIKDGNGDTIWTSPVINNSDDVYFESGTLTLPTVVNDGTVGALTFECSVNTLAKGYLFVDYY